MHGQVTPLDRPLPPGEGRGEGSLPSTIRPRNPEPFHSASAELERRNTVKFCLILSDGWVGPGGAKDLCDDRGSAPGFVRGSFAPTPAPTLSLRMTVGWFSALDNERRNTATRIKQMHSGRGALFGKEHG